LQTYINTNFRQLISSQLLSYYVYNTRLLAQNHNIKCQLLLCHKAAA